MMKNIRIEVPRHGASVQLVLRAGISSGEAVIVASDDVEIRLTEPAPIAAPQPKAQLAKSDGTPSAPSAIKYALDDIIKRLTKLKPTKRSAAVNSIKTMFQFDAPIDDAEANKILETLRKRGDLTIDAKDKLQIRGT